MCSSILIYLIMYFFSYTRAEKINFQILIKNDFLYNKSVIVKWYKLPFLSFYFSSELNENIYIHIYIYSTQPNPHDEKLKNFQLFTFPSFLYFLVLYFSLLSTKHINCANKIFFFFLVSQMTKAVGFHF